MLKCLIIQNKNCIFVKSLCLCIEETENSAYISISETKEANSL